MKHFAIILFILLSISFVAVHIVLPQVTASQELIEDDSYGKGAKEEAETSKQKDAKEKFDDLSYYHFIFFTVEAKLLSSIYNYPLLAGFSNRPFTPPDFL